MSNHNAVIDWSLGETPDADFLAGRYGRLHSIGFDGGVVVPGSSSPSVVRLPWSAEAAADPEEMLVAATSTCHMLWFLDFAKRAGLVVRAYHDEPVGELGVLDTGRKGLTRITLNPTIAFATAPAPGVLAELHHKAHEACFIANSLRAEVVVAAG